MAEPLFDVITLPGEWLASPKGSALHFFEDGASYSICNFVSREQVTHTESQVGRWGRCTTCSNKLGLEHSRLDREAQEARAAEDAEPPRVAAWHLAKAVRFEREAASTRERFRLVHLLAEAKAERIRARRADNPSTLKVAPLG